jgi:hypothetical protein
MIMARRNTRYILTGLDGVGIDIDQPAVVFQKVFSQMARRAIEESLVIQSKLPPTF